MLRKLVEMFEDRVELPIEIDELRAAVVDLGIQDKIIFSAEELDTGILKGAYYQWHESPGPYADPTWTSLIVYPEGVDVAWQRVICAKELIHVCDQQVVKARSADAVDGLARKLVGPFEGTSSDLLDILASTDKLAQYQSLNLLFPLAARKLARKRIAEQTMTPDEIADWAVLPLEQISLMLDEDWDRLSEILVAIGNGDHL